MPSLLTLDTSRPEDGILVLIATGEVERRLRVAPPKVGARGCSFVDASATLAVLSCPGTRGKTDQDQGGYPDRGFVATGTIWRHRAKDAACDETSE